MSIGCLSKINNIEVKCGELPERKRFDDYECPACKGVISRDDMDGKKWYKSYCEDTGKNVRMKLVKHNTNIKKGEVIKD